MSHHYARRATAGMILLLIFCMFASSVTPALGITDDFRIETTIGGDETAPSIPANLIATPIAISQIDLSWDASTDDFLMGGYHIYRDGVLIGTTTDTDYADAGLTADTTYAYYITAFDSFFNESASSSVATGTTLSIPPPATTTDPASSYGSMIKPLPEQIQTLEIISLKDSVIIRFETDDHIRGAIKWGRTASYELGTLSERAFTKRHEMRITGLQPGTVYEFSIEGENKIGRYGVMHTGTWRTLDLEDVFPPGNVIDLTATKEGEDVLLAWVNPHDEDFSKVRIVRSDRFYPTDIADGWVVYEGDGAKYRDEGAGTGDSTLYYTVFTYDELGNISSGAVVSIYVGKGEAPEVPEGDPLLNEILLEWSDIVFMQDGNVIVQRGPEVRIDGSKQLTIAIPYERLPEHLKTILVVIRESKESDKSLKFLLRVDKASAFYTGTLAPFGRSGVFPVQVSVFDYKTAQIGYAKGTLISRIESIPASPVGFLDALRTVVRDFAYMMWFLILLVFLLIYVRKVSHAEWGQGSIDAR